MALVYEPGDALNFRQPFKTLTQDVLRLTNKNNSPVAFKVKTTAPKQYCVRPNAGRIEPGDAVEVQIVLQPMQQEFPADHKCRDKFLIQSIQITPEMDSMPMSELWAIVEREAKGSINEKKLRVKYLAPPTTEPSTASEGNTMPERPASPSKPQPSPARASPATTRQLPGPSPLAKSIDHLESAGEESPEPSSPVTTLATSIGAAERSVDNTLVNKPRLFEETPASSPADTTTYAHEIDDAPKQVPVVAVAAAAARASPAKNDLAVALETANATIASLQTQLGDVKRQLAASEQIAASSSSSSQKQQSRVAVKQQQTVDGFSSQSVVAVALAAFLVGYFFF